MIINFLRIYTLIVSIALVGCNDGSSEGNSNNLTRNNQCVDDFISEANKLKLIPDNTREIKIPQSCYDESFQLTSDNLTLRLSEKKDNLFLQSDALGSYTLSIILDNVNYKLGEIDVVEPIQIQVNDTDYQEGSIIPLSAYVIFSDYTEHIYEDFHESLIIDNENVVALNDENELMAIGEGVAKIQLNIGNSTSNTLTLNVQPLISELKISKDDLALVESTSSSVIVHAIKTAGSSEDVTADVTWEYDNNIISIDNLGNISAISPGETIATAFYENEIVSMRVYVLADDTESSVLIKDRVIYLKVGDKKQLNSEVVLIDNNKYDANDVTTWEASDGNVVSIDSNGLITALSSGQSKITAEVDGVFSDESLVTVVDAFSFNVKSITNGHGYLEPQSIIAAEGSSYEMKINPKDGFQLISISGCSGHLEGGVYKTGGIYDDCNIEAFFSNNAQVSLNMQDHTIASENEMLIFIDETIKEGKEFEYETIDYFYKNIEEPIDWVLNHDSITLSTFSPENNIPVIISTQHQNGTPSNEALAFAGRNGDMRYVAYSANIFNSNDVDLITFTKNSLDWLLGSEANNINIITTSMADSGYFKDDTSVRRWLDDNYEKNYTINNKGSCNYENLKNCIIENAPDIIIYGGHSHGYEYSSISDAFDLIQSKNIPVIFINKERDISSMTKSMFTRLGLTYSNNYWSEHSAYDVDKDYILSNSTLLNYKDFFDRFKDNGFNTEVLNDCSKNFILCNSQSFVDSFKGIADKLRLGAVYLDEQNINAFEEGDFTLLKSTIILADKYRSSIDYPITKQEHMPWFQAMLADWVVHYSRNSNKQQPDLGEYVLDRTLVMKESNASYNFPPTINDVKTFSIPSSGQWTNTGWYALPGQVMTFSRIDNNESVKAKIKLNYHRQNTNRAYLGDYMAPLELMTQRVNLSDNTVTMSTPYGGPIYIYMEGVEENISVQISSSGIAEALMLTQDVFKQPESFIERLQNINLPHIDIDTDAYEIHLRRDRFENAINTTYPTLYKLMEGLETEHIKNMYGLAGLHYSESLSLADTLPTNVINICSANFGIENCVDESLHKKDIIQHANYDQHAHCGSGCSGNPWDSSSYLNPRGWLDNHELGHNLQRNHLNVNFVPIDSKNNWSSYVNRATENSNNIFPYFAKWYGHYIKDGGGEVIYDTHTNLKEVFFIYLSDVMNLSDNGDKVLFDQSCNVKWRGNDASRYVGPWQSDAYAANNSYRMSFYIHLAMKADALNFHDNIMLDNGFDIFTLLYQHSRMFDKYSKTEVSWNENKNMLGFDDFPYLGHSTYSGNNVGSIPGNDFMLVSLSKLTKKNWATYFDIFGLNYSDLAFEQARKHGISGDISGDLFALQTNLPNEQMTEELTSINLLDHDAVWPIDDGYKTPLDCIMN